MTPHYVGLMEYGRRAPWRYVGDGYSRELVTPVYPTGPGEGARHQRWRWPDGTVRLVPTHTVVPDTADVRRALGLAEGGGDGLQS